MVSNFLEMVGILTIAGGMALSVIATIVLAISANKRTT